MSGDASHFLPLFPKRNIPLVIDAILKAGKTCKKETPNDHEDWITRRLYYRLIRIGPFRNGPLDIRLQPEIVSIDFDNNTPAGKIDFLVSCGLGAEVYFAIEAKRLRVRSSDSGKLNAGNDAYVNDGMMRFVNGQYAPFMEAGAMLGYVYDGDTDKAYSGVAKYIRKRVKELKLLPPRRLTKTTLIPGQDINETKHGLKNRSFLIYHIFLAV